MQNFKSPLHLASFLAFISTAYAQESGFGNTATALEAPSPVNMGVETAVNTEEMNVESQVNSTVDEKVDHTGNAVENFFEGLEKDAEKL